MSISETLKKKAAGLAAKVSAKAEEAKAKKASGSNDKIADIDRQIEALKQQGGFEGVISRLELQKAQLKNKIRNDSKK